MQWVVEDGFLKIKVWKKQNGEKELLFEKVVFMLFNKFDLVKDDEIKKDLQRTLSEEIAKLVEGNLALEQIEKNIFFVSTFEKESFEKFLNKVIEALELVDPQQVVKFLENLSVKPLQEPYVRQSDDEQMLVEEGYVEPDWKGKVWEVYHPLLSWLAWVLPWENDEAVMWFWEKMQKEGILSWLEKEGVKQGDVLKIKPSREGWDEFFVMYR